MTEERLLDNDKSRASHPVFISYATADRKQALSVCKAIERRVARCWISTRDVDPGANYQEAIFRAIRNARALVLVFSEAANNSDEIKKELSLASRYHIPVLALRIEDVEPSDAFAYELSTRQWIDAFEGWDQSIDTLVGRVAELEERPATPHRAEPFRRRGLDRRAAIAAGGVVLASSAVGLAWLGLGRDPLPAAAQKLIEEGQAALNEGSPDELATAAARFRQAAEIAPARAEPWGALAVAYARMSWLAPTPQDQAFRSRAEQARQRAIAIDPNNGDALSAGVMALSLYKNWLQFERACREALRRQKHHAGLNLLLSFCLIQVGRVKDALHFVESALESDQKLISAHSIRIACLDDLDRLDDAESEIDAGVRLWPRHYSIWFTRIYYLMSNGRAAEALAMIDDIATRPLGIPEWNFEASRLQAKAMQTRAAADVDVAIKKLLETARRGAGFAENAIMFAGAVGRVDEAYEVIDAYYFGRGFQVANQRYSAEQGQFSRRQSQLTYMLFRKFMQPVRADKRFKPLTAKLGLDDYWTRSGSRPDTPL